MNILHVLFPVIVEDYAAYRSTVAHYQDALGLPLRAQFAHTGFELSWLGPMVVLSAVDPADLVVPRQVGAIFVVDDLEAFWARLAPQCEVLIERSDVPSGRRFIVRHTGGDGRVIEYLQLAAPAA